MLCENLKAARRSKGISQEEMAAKLHVVRQTISKWEKGLSVPDSEMLIKIAEVLDTTVTILLGETIPKEKQDDDPQSLNSLASKLEQVNQELAQRNERRRRYWRIIFLIIGILGLCGIFSGLVSWLYEVYANNLLTGPNADAALIGGADGSTSIYISYMSLREASVIAALAALTVSAVGVWKTKKS